MDTDPLTSAHHTTWQMTGPIRCYRDDRPIKDLDLHHRRVHASEFEPALPWASDDRLADAYVSSSYLGEGRCGLHSMCLSRTTKRTR